MRIYRFSSIRRLLRQKTGGFPMLRIAAEEDVSAMLAIYRPYVLTSTATFEYDPPRRRRIPAPLPRHHRPVSVAISGRRTGRFSATPTQVCPLPGRHMPGAPNRPSISNLRHGERASEKRCTTRWKRSSTPRGITFFTPSSAGKTRTPCASTRSAATAPSLISRPAASSLAGGLT